MRQDRTSKAVSKLTGPMSVEEMIEEGRSLHRHKRTSLADDEPEQEHQQCEWRAKPTQRIDQQSPPSDCLGGVMSGHHSCQHGRIELVALAFAYLPRGSSKFRGCQSDELFPCVEGP